MSQSLQTGSPKMLGRYELMFLLGQGGMGEVHLARLTGAAGFEKLCIVKTILPQMMSDPQFVDRFHHEAKVLVQLNHSNIAQVYDMGEVDDSLYMAIEYVAGVDLSRVEDRARSLESAFPVPVALHIGQQMCEALGYAHRKMGADGAPLGIVHRDVSPQNVMVSYEGEVKVIDFGLAKSTARSKHTMPSTVLGKLGYMSPEQARAEKVDHRSDIYSAGVVLWELLAGRPLFAGGTVGEMVAMMANPKPPPLRELRPELSEAVEKIVMRSLSADPALRYSRADDMARALNEQLVREGMSVGSEDVGNYVRAMCPEEFAAERQLQSRLSLTKRKGSNPKVSSKPEIEGTLMRAPASSIAAGLGSTQLRTPAPAAPLTAAQRALSSVVSSPHAAPAPIALENEVGPRESAPRVISAVHSGEFAVQKSKGPLFAVLFIALLVLGGGGYFGLQMWQRQQQLTAPLPPARPGTEVVAAEPAAQQKPVEQKGEVVAKPTEAVEKPVDAQPVSKKLERLDVGKQHTLYKVLKDGDRFYAQLPSNKPRLKEGELVTLVGEAVSGTTHEVHSAGSVIEVKGSLARLLVDEPEQLPSKVFAVKDSRPKPAAVRREEPARPEQSPVRAERNERVEPAPVGVATVAKLNEGERAEPTLARPDVGARLERQQEAKLVADGRPRVKQLFGLLTKSNGVFASVNIKNNSDVDWHGCDVRLPNNISFQYQADDEIRKGEADSIRLNRFNADKRPPDPQFANGWALVRCKEGAGYMAVKGGE